MTKPLTSWNKAKRDGRKTTMLTRDADTLRVSLNQNDILGLSLDKTRGFAKIHLNGAALFTTALARYAGDVRDGRFPA